MRRVSGAYVLILQDRMFFLADTTVNIDPTPEELAEIALLTVGVRPPLRRRAAGGHALVLELRLQQPPVGPQGAPRGGDRHPRWSRTWRSTARCRPTPPSSSEILQENYPWSRLKQPANVLIFPELQSANIAYKLIWRLAGAEAIGPILLGMAKPVHVLQSGLEVSDIVNMTALCVVDAQELPDAEGRLRESVVKERSRGKSGT